MFPKMFAVQWLNGERFVHVFDFYSTCLSDTTIVLNKIITNRGNWLFTTIKNYWMYQDLKNKYVNSISFQFSVVFINISVVVILVWENYSHHNNCRERSRKSDTTIISNFYSSIHGVTLFQDQDIPIIITDDYRVFCTSEALLLI